MRKPELNYTVLNKLAISNNLSTYKAGKLLLNVSYPTLTRPEIS